jgi:hypothetical protein
MFEEMLYYTNNGKSEMMRWTHRIPVRAVSERGAILKALNTLIDGSNDCKSSDLHIKEIFCNGKFIYRGENFVKLKYRILQEAKELK